MRRREIKVLLFDMGGVLCRLHDPVETFELYDDLDTFMENWLLSESVREFERGAIDAATFARKFKRETNLPYGTDEFLRRFDAWPDRLFDGTIAMLESIPPRYVLAVLSNTNAVHWSRAEIGGILEKHIEHIFLSCKTGLLKPDALAFEYVVANLACAPDQVLFFDDNPLNTSAAEDFGFKSVLVREFADVGRSLIQHDIVPTE